MHFRRVLGKLAPKKMAYNSMYCGAIITLLFLTSCYWHAPSEPVQWTLSLPYGDTRIGFGMTRLLQVLGQFSAPTAHYTPDPAPTAACATGWTDLALAKGRSFFGLIPRPPNCATRLPNDTPSLFLGIPGTKLGFALDWSIALPQN